MAEIDLGSRRSLSIAQKAAIRGSYGRGQVRRVQLSVQGRGFSQNQGEIAAGCGSEAVFPLSKMADLTLFAIKNRFLLLKFRILGSSAQTRPNGSSLFTILN